MKATDYVYVIVIDKLGDTVDVKDTFETMKAARAWFNEVKNDRAYWVSHFESEFETSRIETIQLVKNGEIILDHFPEFK